MSRKSLRALTLSETSSDAPSVAPRVNRTKAKFMGCQNSSSSSQSCSCDKCSSDTSSCSSYSTVSVRKCCFPQQNNCNWGNNVTQETTIFFTVVTPLTDMTTLNGQNTVGFTMTKTNKNITLQWEPFSGRLTTNGVVSLNVLQSLPNLPSYPVYNTVFMQYKTVGRLVPALINPSPPGSTGNFSIYLNVDQSATGVSANDLVTVPGGLVQWTIE